MSSNNGLGAGCNNCFNNYAFNLNVIVNNMKSNVSGCFIEFTLLVFVVEGNCEQFCGVPSGILIVVLAIDSDGSDMLAGGYRGSNNRVESACRCSCS